MIFVCIYITVCLYSKNLLDEIHYVEIGWIDGEGMETNNNDI